jgi:phage gp46-like protein
MIQDLPLTIVLDGQTIELGLQTTEPLVRAVVVSLFTWRRAEPDDDLPTPDALGARMGWWGDSFPPVAGDRIGSRLWLLSRAKLLPETTARAKEYALEALQWLLDDGVATKVEVEAERQGLSTLALAVRIYQTGGTVPRDIRFTNVWEFLHV